MSSSRYYTSDTIMIAKGHGKGLTRQRLWLFSRYVSGARFEHCSWHAQVAELVDALASGASDLRSWKFESSPGHHNDASWHYDDNGEFVLGSAGLICTNH